MLEELDWTKAKASRDLKMCEANYTAKEMVDKLGIKVEWFDPKYKELLKR